MMISLEDPSEAYYVCGVLNSSLARSRINAAISSEAHSEVLGLVTLPQYVGSDVQIAISAAAERCHAAVAESNDAELRKAELELDGHVGALWGVSPADVATAQAATPGKRKRRSQPAG
jgi:hypothetical protein